jgi:cytochrome c
MGSKEGMTLGRMKALWLVPACAAFCTSASLAQGLAEGESTFNKCLPCHAVSEGAKDKDGPKLNGLDGRKIGTASGYRYSKGYEDAGIVFNEAIFSNYIKDPNAMIPGARMPFMGITNKETTKNLWAYLSQFDADGTKK